MMPFRSACALAAGSGTLHTVDTVRCVGVAAFISRQLCCAALPSSWTATSAHQRRDVKNNSVPTAEQSSIKKSRRYSGSARCQIRQQIETQGLWSGTSGWCSHDSSCNRQRPSAFPPQSAFTTRSCSHLGSRGFSIAPSGAATGKSEGGSLGHSITSNYEGLGQYAAALGIDVQEVSVQDDEDLQEELLNTLPDFRDFESFNDDSMTAEQVEAVQQQGRQVLDALKQLLVLRLREERLQAIAFQEDVSMEEAEGMEGVDLDVELTDEQARWVLRYALGSRITQTHANLLAALGSLETDAVGTAATILVQTCEKSQGTLWELRLTDLIGPDAQVRFFRSMMLYKLATDSAEEVAPDEEEALKVIGADATEAALLAVEKRATEPAEKESDNDVVVDDATLTRAFTLFQDITGFVTLQEFGAMEELLVSATEAGQPMTYHDLIAPLLSHLSEETQQRMLNMLRNDIIAHHASQQSAEFGEEPLPPDSMLLFMSDNMPLITSCADAHRDEVVAGLLDVYDLQSQAVSRVFEPPAPGELPPEIAHSPMKPLAQEMSHRITMLVNLYQPQRVAWGAYVDLTKIVRPHRAKNLVKRFKYDHPHPNRDVW